MSTTTLHLTPDICGYTTPNPAQTSAAAEHYLRVARDSDEAAEVIQRRLR